jgi:CheY-like chemotaxis protein
MNIPQGPILVVEDVPSILELITTTLRFSGYPVITATNGEEGLQAVAIERPALIITDILMPKLDGYAMVQKLRLNPQTRDIPVVFLSATYVTPEDKAFALSLGAVRFLEKPIDMEDFLLTVAELLLEGPRPERPPLEEKTFFEGYRARLKAKLQHKEMQIARTRYLLLTLPEEERPAFHALLEEALRAREAIQEELRQVYDQLAALQQRLGAKAAATPSETQLTSPPAPTVPPHHASDATLEDPKEAV